MILLGLGANLPSARFGAPRATLEAALAALEAKSVRVVRLSRWYDTAAVPAGEQPRFANVVAAVETTLDPVALLALLHRVEAEFGRVRGVCNEARAIDLDLLVYGETLCPGPEAPILPHPRMTERAFVLLPLRDVAPNWRHPADGRSLDELIVALPPGQDVRLAQDG